MAFSHVTKWIGSYAAFRTSVLMIYPSKVSSIHHVRGTEELALVPSAANNPCDFGVLLLVKSFEKDDGN
jgi:hypothetical protein